MFTITYTEHFQRLYRKLTKRDRKLKSQIDKVVEILKTNPNEKSIRSHRVGGDQIFGAIWSSRVTGDIRIIWTYDRRKRLVIVLIKIGGHDDVY